MDADDSTQQVSGTPSFGFAYTFLVKETAFLTSPAIRLLVQAFLLASSAQLTACSSDEGPSPEALPCEGERPLGAICMAQIRGFVIDEVNASVSDLPVTVCGPVCFRSVTQPDGSFVVEMNHFVIVSEYSVQAHGSPLASTFYHRIADDTRDGSYDAGTLRVLALPDDGAAFTTKLDLQAEVAPQQTVQSGGVTLSVGEGTVIRLSVADALLGDEGKRFRARRIDETLVPEFVPEFENEIVFALGPFEAEFMGSEGAEPEVALRFENTENWAAGAEVEVLALGTYLDPDWVEPSEFESIGTAIVSDDGTSIDLPTEASGLGFRHMTWLALRP